MQRCFTLAVVLSLLVPAALSAKTYNSPYVDGHVTLAVNDWDADELGVADAPNDCRYAPSDADLKDLYVTWDADSLYVGFTTVNGPGGYGNGYLVFIDTDAQEGITGATDFTSADFYARKIRFPTMGADVIMGAWGGSGSFPTTIEVRACSDPTQTTPVSDAYSQGNPGWKHMEVRVSWNGLFGLGQGVVPVGTTLRFIAAVVGGDGSGAYDAMPTSSTGVESNPATPWNAYTDLDEYHEVVVDGNWDGVPDAGYPPSGSISGTVTLDDPGDTETVVTLTAYRGVVAVRTVTTPPGGGAYTIPLLPDGTYDVTATAVSYLPQTVTGIEIVDEGAVTGVDYLLERVNGKIVGDVALAGGPSVDVTVTAYDVASGAMGGDGPQVVPGGAGHFEISTVVDGTWRVVAEALGYVEQEAVAEIVNEDTVDVGLLTLPVVAATGYAFTDESGSLVYGVTTTVSLPADTLYYFARAWLEPQDDEGRLALWDAAAQESVRLAATRLDPAYPPLGTVVFAGADSVLLAEPVVTADMFEDGRAVLMIADDAVEVVRVKAYADTLEGVLEVGVGPAEPARLSLTADHEAIAAGTGIARITGQLVDASGNAAHVGEVGVDMTASGVGGRFSVSAPETDPNGRFEVDFSGAVAGVALVSAIVDAASGYAGLAVDTLAIAIEPGPAAAVELSAAPASLRAGGTATVTARIIDEWGNTVAAEGVSVTLLATPSALVASLDSPIVTDATGVATGEITAASSYGLIELSGSAGALDVQPIFIAVDATIVTVDETAPESDPAHNSDPGMDLTILRAANGPDTLVVSLDFASNWDGVHIALLLEAAGDAAGGAGDPFGFPVNYGHALLPEFVFTYKYAAQDYADLRKFLDGQWWHYDFVNEEWRIGWAEGVNAVSTGHVVRTADDVRFRLPLPVLEVAAGDTLRVEAYVMQETDGVKRTALDSTPQDATHDMLPDSGNWWDTAANPVTLTQYAEFVLREQGYAPELSGGTALPSVAEPGDLVTYAVEVADGGGGIGDVFIDLSELGGSTYARMLDDGFGADETAGDGTYTAADTLAASASDGEHTVLVTAKDIENVWAARLGIVLAVDNPATALRQFDDAVGDDHGPAQTSDGTPTGDPIDGLYYTYPTNRVFLPGSFDITEFEVFQDGDWLVFRTHVQDLANHQDPGAADWGAPQPSEQTCADPYRTDLNLQKIDIYIDALEGQGATSGFPNRYVDIANVDAWDYGIAVEGWGKWFVESNDSNSQAGWSLYKTDADVRMCDSHAENWVDVRVRSGLFGDDLADIENWDIVVCLSSHDGGTDDQNLGGMRWVNQNTQEWQFGGGRDSESGRDRDANVIDVAVSPGANEEPGRTQAEMLDYTTAEATERFENDKTAVVLEASFAEDFSPPAIAPFPGDPDVPHVPWVALDGAPAVVWTTITDFSDVAEASLTWRAIGDSTRHTVPMVNLIGDVWAADVSREDIAAVTNVVTLNKTGPARVILGTLYARDASSNANEISVGPYEIALPEPWAASQTMANLENALADSAVHDLVFQDGTVVSLDLSDLPATSCVKDLKLTPVPGAVDTDIRSDMEYVGVARDIELLCDGIGAGLAGAVRLTMHYPDYDAGSLDQAKFGIFEWVGSTRRWIAVGGTARPDANAVGADVSKLGRYGLYFWEAFGGEGRGLSGVLVEPNPFSPNGDGLYDQTRVVFTLGRAADHVNIEFYDLSGHLARRLVFHAPADYVGGTPVEIVWDGTDADGSFVPYGLYVMRVEAKFKTSPTYERVNAAVAVVK